MELSRSTTSLQWRKSSRSITGECLEVASNGQTVFVRDSKNEHTVLTFPELAWRRHLLALKQRGTEQEAAMARGEWRDWF